MNSWCTPGLYCVRIRKCGPLRPRIEGALDEAANDRVLHARFSDRDAVATDWDETRRALEDAELFWIATVRADGRPHVTPLVAVWLDYAIYFATGVGEQKAVNLRADQ